MPDAEFRVYLSSTIEDLTEEREVARRVLSSYAVVGDSYRAKEDGTVESCVADVRKATLYIGILGHRYGWIPGGEGAPGAKSITELEYDACEPKEPLEKRIPRLIFVRTTSPDKFRDSENRDATKDRIRQFRERAGKGQRRAEFSDIKDFEVKLLQSFVEYEREHFRRQLSQRPTFDMAEPWATALKPVVLLHVPGTDDDAVDRIVKARPDLFASAAIPPNNPKTATLVEKGLQQGQAACLFVSTASLSRMTDPASSSRFEFVAETLTRRGNIGVVLRAGVAADALPMSWRTLSSVDIDPAALVKSDVLAREAVGAMFNALSASLVQEPTTLTRVALPLVVIAPTRQEVAALMDPALKAFEDFEDMAEKRAEQFDTLLQSARAKHKEWPDGFYGESRDSWRCFGDKGSSVLELIETAIDAINDAPDGSRERRDMQLTKILLRHYRLDEYLEDRHGSKAALAAVARNALVCLDETALFDPKLCKAAEALLAGSRAAIVSVSPCDPAHLPTRDLLSASSFLLGALVTRFKAEYDPQCELSLNSEQRLLRWLRTAIPRLLRDIDGRTGVPSLLQQMEAKLTTSGA
jgi:hypothetical protein